jgi:hypothetical protein
MQVSHKQSPQGDLADRGLATTGYLEILKRGVSPVLSAVYEEHLLGLIETLRAEQNSHEGPARAGRSEVPGLNVRVSAAMYSANRASARRYIRANRVSDGSSP